MISKSQTSASIIICLIATIILGQLAIADSKKSTRCPRYVGTFDTKYLSEGRDLRCFSSLRQAKKNGYLKFEDVNHNGATFTLNSSLSFLPTGCPPIVPSQVIMDVSQVEKALTFTPKTGGTPFTGLLTTSSGLYSLSRSIPFTCTGGTVVNDALERFSFYAADVSPKGDISYIIYSLDVTCSTTLTCTYGFSANATLVDPTS